MSALPAAIQNNTDMQINETNLERALRDYIKGSKRFRYGGIVNLLGTIASVMEGESEDDRDNWHKASEIIEICSQDCDLKYTKEY